MKYAYLNISLVMVVILERAVSPGCAGIFCNRVLMVSIGALDRGPIAPDTRPIIVVCHEGSGVSLYCGCQRWRISLNSVYAVKLTAWLEPGFLRQ